MEVFLKIQRKTTTVFTEAKESSTVLELKRMVEGVLKRPPKEQLLFKDHQLLEDRKTRRDCGFTTHVATAEDPATVTLALAEDAFRVLHPNPFSRPLFEAAIRNGLDTVSAKEEAVHSGPQTYFLGMHSP